MRRHLPKLMLKLQSLFDLVQFLKGAAKAPSLRYSPHTEEAVPPMGFCDPTFDFDLLTFTLSVLFIPIGGIIAAATLAAILISFGPYILIVTVLAKL